MRKSHLVETAYDSSGVNIAAGNRAAAMMRESVRATYDERVLSGVGSFGGLFAAGALKEMRSPVLVASTDGVGTKVKLAAQAKRFESIGCDIVNHCVNDILVQGARPLFFLDYIATSRLQPEMMAEIVTGMSAACRASGCALLGGETAEMPGVYAPDEFDVAGTIVGVVERERILPRVDLHAGDVLIGLRSSGPHTNGYSLIRKVFAEIPLETVFPKLGRSLGDVLLAPHRSYMSLLQPVLEQQPALVKALVHLTGGAFVENIPRVLPEHIGATVRLGTWQVPPLFSLIQELGDVSSAEMFRVFNMGIGMVVVVAAADAHALQSAVQEECWVIGELAAGRHEVVLA